MIHWCKMALKGVFQSHSRVLLFCVAVAMNNTFRYVHKQEGKSQHREKATIRNDNSPGKSMK
jgi:hypothetical protein